MEIYGYNSATFCPIRLKIGFFFGKKLRRIRWFQICNLHEILKSGNYYIWFVKTGLGGLGNVTSRNATLIFINKNIKTNIPYSAPDCIRRARQPQAQCRTAQCQSAGVTTPKWTQKRQGIKTTII